MALSDIVKYVLSHCRIGENVLIINSLTIISGKVVIFPVCIATNTDDEELDHLKEENDQATEKPDLQCCH